MNRENIIASFANAVSEVEENHFEGTYHWHLGSDDNGNDWAIVMAYMDYNDNGNEELIGLCRMTKNQVRFGIPNCLFILPTTRKKLSIGC